MCTDFTCARTIVVEVSMSAFSPSCSVIQLPTCKSCREGYRQPCRLMLIADVRSRKSWPVESQPEMKIGTDRSIRVLRRSSIPEWTRTGVPKKAWLKFPLRLYGWVSQTGMRTRAIPAAMALRRTLSYARHGLCEEAVERQKYINTAA